VELHVTIESAPTEELRTAILQRLGRFNAESGYPADPQTVAVVARAADGKLLGGLWGKTVYDWLFVEYLVVEPEWRGRNLGASLLSAAEQVAIERGCVGAWLTTFPFQARAFYEKQGYRVFAELENSPRENVRIFMRKTLASSASA
jgi:GNAT superfamily N-acetyltransferase